MLKNIWFYEASDKTKYEKTRVILVSFRFNKIKTNNINSKSFSKRFLDLKSKKFFYPELDPKTYFLLHKQERENKILQNFGEK